MFVKYNLLKVFRIKMGGYGSGIKAARRPKVEGCKSIDVNNLAATGYLDGCTKRPLSWSRRSKLIGVVDLSVVGNVVSLSYPLGVPATKISAVPQKVQLRFTRPHFGGVRRWFECPVCLRRVAAIYAPEWYFACRHCSNLKYSSQSESAFGRALRKRNKLQARIYEPGVRDMKKKGMRQDRFDTLHVRYLHASAVADRFLDLP
jgi:hypothetical protein